MRSISAVFLLFLPLSSLADAAIPPPAEPRVQLELAWVLPAGDGQPERQVRGARPAGAVARLHTGRFAYSGDVAAAGLSVVLAIPRDEEYVPGTALGPGAEVSFSVDGGQTFAAGGDLQVPTGLDGELRPATASDFTHVRWLLTGRFPPGTSGLVSFRTLSPVSDARAEGE